MSEERLDRHSGRVYEIVRERAEGCASFSFWNRFSRILIPWYGHAEWFLLETNGLFHHLLCPILAVACLPFLHPMRKKDALLAVIPTFIYRVILYTLNYFRKVDGPYPFLKIHDQPWYMSICGL